MSRPKFSPDELLPSGKMYPGMDLMGRSIPETPILSKPIEARENWKLLFAGEKPYWIPVWGWFLSDAKQFRPRIHPDNIANHQVMDGGPPFDFSGYGSVIKGLNDLEWHWVEGIKGATPLPGKPKILDINKWEEYLQFPNLDDWDWDTLAKQNVDYLGTDKANQFGIQCGLWERLMCTMDVAEASISMVDEDQKPGVHRFFDVYTNWLIDYIGRVKDVCNIDSVVMHEDWAHAQAPFFSNATAREMLVPYMQRIVKYVHSRGMFFENHCCGACELLIPVFIESGFDIWAGQAFLNDMGGLAKQYKDRNFIFVLNAPDIGPEVSDEDMRKAVREWVEEYKDYRVAVSSMRIDGDMTKPYHPNLFNAIYEYSRIAFQDEE